MPVLKSAEHDLDAIAPTVQSLNEMTNTLRRKTTLSLDDIGELVSDIRSLTTVHDLTTSVYARG